MTTCTHALSHPAAGAASHKAEERPIGLLRSWWNAYWEHRSKRAAVVMLNALDDRNLRDIGLSRSEIESVVYGRHDRRVRYE